MYVHGNCTVKIFIHSAYTYFPLTQFTLSNSILFSAWQNIEVAWLLF